MESLKFQSHGSFTDAEAFVNDEKLTTYFNSIKKNLRESQRKLEEESQIERKNIIRRWTGQVVRIAAERAYKLSDPDEIQMRFSGSIIQEYRKFITQMEVATTNHQYIDELQETFQQAAISMMQFLHYEYPQPGKSSHIEKENISADINLKYSIVQKISGIKLDRSSKEKLRIDLKKFINRLAAHSEEKYKDFSLAMSKFFSEFESTSISYTLSKRIINTGSKHDHLDSPAFLKIDKEILQILMEWIDQLLIYFKHPAKLLQNRYGFCNSEGNMVKLAYRDRGRLSKLFEQGDSKLSKELKQIQKQLRKTITNIILISNNTIKSSRGKLQDIHYLDKEEVSLVIICQYISKAMNDYVIDVLTTILMQIRSIEESFYEMTKQEHIQQLQLITFTIPDLFKCRCLGSRSQIERVMRKIDDLKEAKEQIFEIVLVNNRLDLPSRDIRINLVLKDPQIGCYFICQIQLVVSANNSQTPYSFSDFLLEQSQTHYGLIAELGLLYHNSDFKHKYVDKRRLAFQNISFEFEAQNNGLLCKLDPSHSLVNTEVKLSYICNECFKYIYAYLYYFRPKKCQQCEVYICPICYFALYGKEKSAEIMMSLVPKLSNHFQYAAGPFFFEDPTSTITNLLWQNYESKKYLGVLTFENNMHFYKLKLVKLENVPEENIKRLAKMGNKPDGEAVPPLQQIRMKLLEDYVHTSFTNEKFDFDTTKDICLIVKLRQNSRLGELSREDFLQQKSRCTLIAALHQNFSIQSQQTYIISTNEQQKHLILDYKIQPRLLKDVISDNNIKRKLMIIKKSRTSQHVLNLKHQAINFTFLQELSENDRNKIKEVSINKGSKHNQYDINEQFQLLKKLGALRKLMVEWTPSYSNVLNLTNLQQIYIFYCNLKDFDFAAYPNIQIIHIKKSLIEHLPILRLPQLTILQLIDNKISSIDTLSESQIPNIDRICIEKTSIKTFPLFPQGKFDKLRVLGLRQNSLEVVENLKYSRIPKLKYLILEKNMIKGTFPSVAHFSLLEHLRLTNNQIQIIEGFEHSCLRCVAAADNKLKKIPNIRCGELYDMWFVRNQISDSEELCKTLSEITVKNMDIAYNDKFQIFPLVKTKVEYFRIEKMKILFEIDDMWVISKLPEQFYCDECGCIITTFGRYSGMKKDNHGQQREYDYCKECYDNELPDDEKDWLKEFVVLPGQQINRNI